MRDYDADLANRLRERLGQQSRPRPVLVSDDGDGEPARQLTAAWG